MTDTGTPQGEPVQPIPTDDSTKNRYDGMATAAAIVLWGALCLPASSYFNAHGALHTAWTVAGITLAMIGVAGAFTEAASLSRKEALSDFGVAIALLALAFGGYVLSSVSWLGTPFVGGVKALVAFCVTFTVFGFTRGIGRAAETSHRRRDDVAAGVREPGPTRTVKIQALIVGLLGTATAVANFLLALHPKK